MLVLEIKFVSNDRLNVQMNTDVLAIGKDQDSDEDRALFEREIIPESYAIIDVTYKDKTLSQNPNLCVDMMNVIVRYAKNKNYRLERLGQNPKFPDVYQLKFVRETNERFMGSNKGICETI